MTTMRIIFPNLFFYHADVTASLYNYFFYLFKALLFGLYPQALLYIFHTDAAASHVLLIEFPIRIQRFLLAFDPSSDGIIIQA